MGIACFVAVGVGAVSLSTAPQTGMSLVRFPIGIFEFFALDSTQPVPGIFSGW